MGFLKVNDEDKTGKVISSGSNSGDGNLTGNTSHSLSGNAHTSSRVVKSSRKTNMKMLFLIILLLIPLGILGFFLNRKYSSITPKPLPEVKPPASHETVPVVTNATSAHNALGFNLLKVLFEKDQNVVISPLSISLAFSMVYNGADKETKKQMAEVMFIDNINEDELNRENFQLMQGLEDKDPKVEISIANSIWARKEVNFNQSFLDLNNLYYRAETSTLDFSSPLAADTINEWVSASTKEKITSIVDSPIDPLTVMFLINAVYFKGTWTFEFDKSKTEEKDFYVGSFESVRTDFMKQERDNFLYLENDDFQAVNMPYGESEKLSMYVFLPKTDLASFFANLSLNNWDEWIKSFGEKEGTVELPKFKVEYETSLVSPFEYLGMTKAFSPMEADFSGIRSQRDIYISDAKHKTFIEVNEEGTEAAAVTSIEMVISALPSEEERPFYMVVDRPFFFAISDSDSGQILFSGFIYDPSQD